MSFWRARAELSRAAGAVESSYDMEARHNANRQTVWTGYKAPVSETCDEGLPPLITVATTQDVSRTDDIHKGLRGKSLLPEVHLVDAGYVDTELLAENPEQYGITLLGPPHGVKG